MFSTVIGLHFIRFLNKAFILPTFPNSEVVLMPKLNEKKRKWIIRQIRKGMPKKDIALAMKISRMALWKIEQNYKIW